MAKLKSKEIKEPIIYIGPDIPNKLVKYTVYRNGLPKMVEEMKQEIEGLEHLFVGVSKLNESNKLLNDKTSYLSVMYAKVAEKWRDK